MKHFLDSFTFHVLILLAARMSFVSHLVHSFCKFFNVKSVCRSPSNPRFTFVLGAFNCNPGLFFFVLRTSTYHCISTLSPVSMMVTNRATNVTKWCLYNHRLMKSICFWFNLWKTLKVVMFAGNTIHDERCTIYIKIKLVLTGGCLHRSVIIWEFKGRRRYTP